jgi:KDO2-lipid IV(A) lauroyltransferase
LATQALTIARQGRDGKMTGRVKQQENRHPHSRNIKSIGRKSYRVSSRKRKFKDYVEYAVFRGAGAIIRALPLEFASSLMGKAWRLVGPRTHRHRRALDNLALAMPELSEEERRRIARDQWENLGRTACETFVLDKILADPSRTAHSQDALVKRLREDGKGAVMVSMHAGNWELTLWPGVVGGLNSASVYQRMRNRMVDDYVRSKRAMVYPGGMFGKTRGTGRALHTWVSEGGHLGLLTDHREIRGGIEIEFFGIPALTSPFPAALARQFNVPLIAGRTVRLSGVRFRVDAVELEVPYTHDRKADVQAATQAIHAQLEAWIREYPEQWMWGQRRWHQPLSSDALENAPPETWRRKRMRPPAATSARNGTSR